VTITHLTLSWPGVNLESLPAPIRDADVDTNGFGVLGVGDRTIEWLFLQ
jgi:hypothetical protein